LAKIAAVTFVSRRQANAAFYYRFDDLSLRRSRQEAGEVRYLRSVGWDGAVLFLRHGRRLFALDAGALAQEP
jgi:hypothetical protein